MPYPLASIQAAVNVATQGGVIPDVVAPTVTITCDKQSPSVESPFTFTYTWSEDVTGFASGDAGIANGAKGTFTAVSASVYTLVVTPATIGNVTATVAAGVCADAAGNLNDEATPLSVFYGVLDPSVLDDGALPAALTGDTWAVASGQAVNTPTLGDELATNGSMEDGDPPTGWNAFNGATLDGVADERTGGAGAQSLDILRGTNNAVAGSSAVTNVVGKWHVLTAWVKKVTSNLTVSNGMVTGATQISTSWIKMAVSYRATSTNGAIYPQLSGTEGQSGRFDDISNKTILDEADVFASCVPGQSSLVISVSLNNDGAKAGVVLALDSASSPLNYVIAYIDRRRIALIKCLNGVYSNVVPEASYSYVAGAFMTVIKNGTTYTLKYNNAQLGTDQTIEDAGIVNNTLYGFFSTDPTSPVLEFDVAKLLDSSVKITFLGDSITQSTTGYAIITSGQYERSGRRVYYTNRAVGGGMVIGEDAADLTAQVTAAASDDADKIIILMGTNDTNTTDTFRSTYEAQVNALKASNTNATIYLLGILERFDGVTRRTTQNPMIQTVAANTGATYIDTDGWIVDGDTADGLHPTAAGHLVIAGELLPLIAP